MYFTLNILFNRLNFFFFFFFKTRDEMYVIVGEGRAVTHTNGTIVPIGGGNVKVVWPADARRLSYEIRETTLGPSVPLARWYLRAQE